MEFTPERKAAFDTIVARYPVKRSALLPTLQLIQDQHGFLTTEGIEYAAALLGLTPAQVHDTASYYTLYRFGPEGKVHLEFCTNLSCALAGADDLLAETCRRLGIREGETTNLPKQAGQVMNVALSYEKYGLMARLALTHTGAFLYTVGTSACWPTCGRSGRPPSRSTSNRAGTRS